MAGVNIGNVGLTFTRYLDGVVETLNQSSKSRRLVRKDDKWTGSHIEWRVHTARNHALGYVEDGGVFPSPDKQDYQAAKAYRKFVVGSIQLTDGVMATASKSRNVARDVITSEVQGMMSGILKFENGMFFKNGDGSIADIKVAYGASTLVEVDDARMVWDKATYQVYDSGLTTNRGNFVVTSTASAPDATGYAQITGTGLPSGTLSTDKLVWNGSVNRAITGLKKLVDDTATTFQNINVSTFPRFTSLVLGNSSTNRELTPTLFRQMLAGLAQKSGSDSPSEGLTCMTNGWQAINVEELYEGEVRMDPSSKVAGMAIASFQTSRGKVDIVVDSDAPYNKMYFVDFSKIYRAVQKKLGWRREGGSIFKRSDTSGVWTATALEICELYIKERHTSGRIDDLSETHSTMY